jgi:hypothetical protein
MRFGRRLLLTEKMHHMALRQKPLDQVADLALATAYAADFPNIYMALRRENCGSIAYLLRLC